MKIKMSHVYFVHEKTNVTQSEDRNSFPKGIRVTHHQSTLWRMKEESLSNKLTNNFENPL